MIVMRNNRKVAIIGAGRVGASVCYHLAHKSICDIVLIDIVEGLPQGEALDIMQALSIHGISANILGSNDYAAMSGADLVIITAGVPRKPGMDRLDLLDKNAGVIEDVVEKILTYAPTCLVMIVTNPVDVMCYLAYKRTGFPPHRIFGQSGVLDAGRFKYFVASQLGVSPSQVEALVLGGHGDSMVPLPRYTTVCGVPITELMSEEEINRLCERTRRGGSEIVAYFKTGSAYHAPGAAVAEMAECIVTDKKKVLPVSAYLQGEYGIKDVYIGVPVLLGSAGVERIIQIDLTPQELEQLQKSASIYQEYCKRVVG